MPEKDKRPRKHTPTRKKRLYRRKYRLPEKARPGSDIERVYTLMFGTSGDVGQEYKEYQEYWGVDPRNFH